MYITAGAATLVYILVTYCSWYLHLWFNIALSQTFSRVSPICSVVSILPRVDLTDNTEMDWFCILSLFRLDTLDHKFIEAEHLRGPERIRECGNVPGGTPTLADVFRRNISASGFVLPEHFRGGTNPLWHRPHKRATLTHTMPMLYSCYPPYNMAQQLSSSPKTPFFVAGDGNGRPVRKSTDGAIPTIVIGYSTTVWAYEDCKDTSSICQFTPCILRKI